MNTFTRIEEAYYVQKTLQLYLSYKVVNATSSVLK